MSSCSPEARQWLATTPLILIRKLLKPHKINPAACKIHAKCEFRNPSGSIWDRLVLHELKKEADNSISFLTGGIADLCVSLAWAGVTHGARDDITVTVFPGAKLDNTKLQLLHGFGANVVLSYQQDPDRLDSQQCLNSHIKKFEATSGVLHHKILPGRNCEAYTGLVEDLDEGINWDIIVCGGQDTSLLEALRTKFPSPATTVFGVNFSENTFTESFNTNDSTEMEGITWIKVSDAECYDMARRLVREEGLLVGPISGGVMAVATKQAELLNSESTTDPCKTILAILPDSLQNSSRDFLSVDWMVEKGYYLTSHLESLFWWYEMAIENMSPPEVLIVVPTTPVKCVHAAMVSSSTERCVVVTSLGEETHVVGVITLESVLEVLAKDNDRLVGDVCNKQFGLIDSKAKFSELEPLLRKHNWVVNMHCVTVVCNTSYATGNSSREQHLLHQISEDVLAAINMADFVRYKKKVEKHHLTEFGLAMSDGIPSDVWLERFNKQPATSPLN